MSVVPFLDAAKFGVYAREFMNERSPFLKLTAGDSVPDGLAQIDVLLGGTLAVDRALVDLFNGDPNAIMKENLDGHLTALVNFFNYACIVGDGTFAALPECDRDDKDGFSVAGYDKTRADYHVVGTNPAGAVWFPPGNRAFYKLPLPLFVTPFECEAVTENHLGAPVYGYRIAAAVYGKAVR